MWWGGEGGRECVWHKLIHECYDVPVCRLMERPEGYTKLIPCLSFFNLQRGCSLTAYA